MLPSIGSFKDISCPFFDKGLCVRPFCHFRHLRKEFSEHRSLLEEDVSVISTLSGEENDNIDRHLTSEADRKNIVETDLQGTMVCRSRSSDVESDSENCAKKEEEVPPSAFISRKSQNVPEYKPTPISVLKNRHLPVVYPSSLFNSTTRLKRKSDSIESFLQTKLKKDCQINCETSIKFSSLFENVFEQRNVFGVNRDGILNTHPATAQSVKGEIEDIPSEGSLKQNSNTPSITYVPSPAEYSDSEEPVKPICEFLTNPSSVGDISSYRSSPLNCIEQEYESFYCKKNIQEYMTNDVSKRGDLSKINLDFNAFILNDTDDKLNCSNLITVDEMKETSNDEQIKHSECYKNISLTVVSEMNVIKKQIEYDKKELGNGRKDSKDKKENKSKRKGDSKKESDERYCNKKRTSDYKLQHASSVIRKCVKESNARKDGQNKDNKRKDKRKESRRKSEDTIKAQRKRTNCENGHTMKNNSCVNFDSSKKLCDHKNHSKDRYSYKSDAHKTNSSHKIVRDKSLRIEGSSKSDNHNTKRKSSSVYPVDSKKMMSDLEVISEPERRQENKFTDEPDGTSLMYNGATDTYIQDDSTSADKWACSEENECTKKSYTLFEESQSNLAENKPEHNSQQDEEETYVFGRRRIAHDGAQDRRLLLPPTRRHSVPHPSQTLSERYQKVWETHNSVQSFVKGQTQAQADALTHSQSILDCPSSMNHEDVISSESQSKNTTLSSEGKRRIAHVPNVSRLLDAKRKLLQKLHSSSESSKIPCASTNVQTLPKGVQRIAHVPLNTVLARPVVQGVGGKIPSNIRQKYLNILMDEYLKLTSTEQEARERAEDEEKSIYFRSTTRDIYASHVSNTINRLRKASQINRTLMSAKICRKNENATGHASLLRGAVDTKGSRSIEKRKPSASVVSKTLYESLSQFIMTEEQLKQNGFPMSHGEEEGVAVIHNFFKKTFLPQKPSERLCVRCSKKYYVDDQGLAIEQGLCVYHWGRPFQRKIRDGWESLYNCCQSHRDAIGCSVGNCHVSENFDPNHLEGFVKTLPKETLPEDDYSVYALDCEMCYTTEGLELTRVSVIDTNFNIVFESLVKPERTILDYNTRFSGVKENDLKYVSTNIFEVQSVLLSFIHDKTILVGHSLESDFKALKLIHNTVIDTSVVYPHKMGLPKKRGLKSLCREFLQKIIQENVGGHDSTEDACAAMELMLLKVKKDSKTAR
ncbi:hypothetical protein R5R35_014763 [Gryllus longicercus]|uniref:C3H1-type domain-containing protein n=1 Tax=Gryllus longicercus TaxID=2509291 RepID=A0AAN9VTT8_9ORTH